LKQDYWCKTDISGYGVLNRVFNIILFVYKNNTNEVLIVVSNLKLVLMFKGMLIAIFIKDVLVAS